MLIDLTPEELALIIEALDSHAYWQLSDKHYRNDGFVLEPGSDDPEKAAEIEACDNLALKLRPNNQETGSAPHPKG
jgi:hypothetical protein